MNKLLFYIRKITITGLFVVVLLSLGSCKKFLTPNPEPDAITASNVFTTEASATSAVLGIYTMMMEGGIGEGLNNGNLGAMTGLAADELNDYTQHYLDWEKDQVDYVGASVPGYYFWSTGYSVIYQCNAAIEGMSGTTDSVMKQLLGEAYFVRAFCYFNMVNMWGAVPLVTTTNYTTTATLARTDTSDVYKQILGDLREAESLLTTTYPSGQEVRANVYVAQALLARYYLYQGNYAMAETEADSVLAGPYQLETSLNQVFLTTSTEVIWQLLPTAEGHNNTFDYSIYTPTSSGPVFYLTSSLVGAFEPGDQRASVWVTPFTYSGTTYYYASKYVAAPSAANTEDNVAFRLAEQYLIRAESRAEQGNLSGAASDLNMIRNRAGLANTTAATQPALLTAILQERRVELFTEWGHRWFDLKRTGNANAVLGALKSTWTSDAQFLPIPQNEIAADPNLTQNPGY